MPITGESVNGIQSPEARLDISAVGFRSPQELRFFDVRIFNPNSPSYAGRDPSALYVTLCHPTSTHENSKKNDYIDRVQSVDCGSFTPLIYSNSGGWGKEASTFHTRLAKLIAQKRKEEYCHVISFIKKRIRFSILRTTFIALRGCRFKHRKTFEELDTRIVDLDTNLIDDQVT